MRLKVLFFGQLKDVAGAAEDRLEIADGSTLRTVFDHYAGRLPRLGSLAGSIVMARNHEFAPLSTSLGDGDEVAFLPPVSGGSGRYREVISTGGNFYALTRKPLRVPGIAARVLQGSDGAVATFEGVVRNNTNGRRTRWLEYDAYEPLAVKTMAQIGAELAAAHDIGRIAMVHRLGHMLIGETSVAIVVTAPHRKAAFDACREAIDRLKRRVPIWKKEHFEDGEVWVEGEWDPNAPVAARR